MWGGKMPILPDNKQTFWMFPDNVIDGAEYKFLQFEPSYKTKNNNSVPVFVLYGKIKGKDKPEIEGELLTAVWNIGNYDELKKQLGENTDDWNEKLSFKINVDGDKFNLTPVEVV